MPAIIRNVVLACALASSTVASANVITDWDVKAVALASPGVVGQREVTLVHVGCSTPSTRSNCAIALI
jgi:hypothetical protein